MKELQSLIEYGQYNPALPPGHPFSGVQSGNYWSSTSHEGNPAGAWFVYLGSGRVYYYGKANTVYVWPVRGPE